MNSETRAFRKKIREVVANYIRSEGCSCCQDVASHARYSDELGKLLKVPKYRDGSGYDFSKFISK